MIKIGDKTKEWIKVRKELKKEFEETGITQCEIGLEGCTRGLFLGFAHTKKRRDVTDLKRVVLACSNCHSKIEYACHRWTGKSMEDFLEGIIKNRSQSSG
jgi:sugar phosphate isomerase/epimerase